ncbi:MAG: MFS transporter [Azospirillaceae bacterium]|nr:MFS transporter [Azospirillaceae bacterium]
MVASTSVVGEKPTHFRYYIIILLFIITSINYADRSAMGITGPLLTKEFGLSPSQLGFVLSGFGWAYVIGQLPGGWLLDRFGSKNVYAASIFLWSLFTFGQGFVGFLPATMILSALFGMLFMVGLAESPSFPANSRVVAAWFPGDERGTASAIFNAAQYFATVMFAPLMGWIAYNFGWAWVFRTMGCIGFVLTVFMIRNLHSPAKHPLVNRAEVDYIAAGGGLVDLDQKKPDSAGSGAKWDYVRQLFSSRMMVGIFIGQFCINALTYFFISWFPIYLVQARGMSILKAGFVASLPAICGFTGGILGGLFSDFLLRRGYSLSVARKTPIVLGMSCALIMVACNYTDREWLVVALMALAFFGKGVGALGWAVMSDTAPKQITGLTGGVFNMCGNLSSISTPIVIGFIIQATGSFNGALVFVGANAVLAIISYLVIVGDIKRLELKV